MRPRGPHPPATQQPHRGGWKRKAAGRRPPSGSAAVTGSLGADEFAVVMAARVLVWWI